MRSQSYAAGAVLLALTLALALPSSAAAASPPTDSRGLPLWEIAVYDDFPVLMRLEGPAALQDLLARVPIASFDRDQIRPTGVPGAPGSLEFIPRVTPEEAEALRAAGYRYEVLPDREQEGRRAVEAFWAEQADKGFPATGPDKALYYPTHAQIGSDFAALAAAHPTLARTFTWGSSVLGRELWGIVISDDVHNTEPEPEVRLSATIHGDEPVDMVMLWNLAHYLVNNYGQAGYEDVTDLVNSTEIHIMPLHNPDGYVAATRRNAFNIDLNRNFPEPAGTDPIAQIETQHFMAHALDHHFVVSQNGHGGALVVNYPWDWTFTRAPDDAALIQLSLEYSTFNLPMYTSPVFPQGITNGADWYVATGTLQDWSYHVTDCIDVTVEVSDVKWPAAATLDAYWDDNRESLLHYIRAASYGVHGVVTSSRDGLPLDATLTVTGIDMPVSTDPDHGDYYKLLPTGTFELTFTAEGYLPETFPAVATNWGTPTVLDVELDPAIVMVLADSDFESGIGGWVGDWGLEVPAEGYASANSLTDSPGGNYDNNAELVTAMASPVDLSGAAYGEITFWARWEIENSYDGCFLEASTDGGYNWTPLATQHTDLTGGQGVQVPAGVPVFDNTQADWVYNVASLEPYLGESDFRVRFRLATDESQQRDGFAFDDFMIEVLLPDTSAVPDPEGLVARVRAWPNPFNPRTTVAFTVPRNDAVRVAIYDLQGRLVRTLVDEPLDAGPHQRSWDGLTDRGGAAASGVYLAMMKAGGATASSKLTLIR